MFYDEALVSDPFDGDFHRIYQDRCLHTDSKKLLIDRYG